ncbi:hypothetical protein LIER_44049 [Lithospermum erythrorhizon]|uniref:Uncharacterized protein n=1 Tax=Lithospermum erythrorhizon TaxID=34254 RepID=A0AAV3NLE8_LITER
MVCSKAGEKFIKKGPYLERRYKRADIQTGCREKMGLKMDWLKKGYRDESEHKAMIDVHVKNGISVRSTYDDLLHTYGIVEDMGFTRTYLWNYVSSVKRMKMFSRDAVVMHKWLRDQSISK